MRIGVDLRPLQTGSKSRGIGYYVANLVESLLKADDHNDYYLFYMMDEGSIEISTSSRCTMCPLSLTRKSTREEAEVAIGDAIRDHSIDIFINTSHFENDINHPYAYPCRSVAIVYDLIPALFFNQYLKAYSAERQVQYLSSLHSLRSYDRLLAISDCTKRDTVELLGIPESKVDVISGGVSHRFHPLEGMDAAHIREKYSIGQDFYICTGGIDYRKNLDRLIEAFAILCKKKDDISLVIVCSIDAEQASYFKHKASGLNVPPDRLILTNHVPDEDLVLLYNASIGVVFPSLYEGFGLPVLEGMACGKPVITSKTSSMPEVCRDGGLLVDPYDARDISDAMLRLAEDAGLRESLSRRSLDIARTKGWDKVAETALRSLESLHEKCMMPGLIESGQAKKYRLAYFSPLSPKMSGISNYSEELLPYLLRYSEIDLYVDDYVPSNKKVAGMCRVFGHEEFDKRIKEAGYDMIIYQMGNSRLYHEYMYPLIEKYPGLVVLHDLSIHGFIHASMALSGDPERYVEEMRFCHGIEGERHAMKVLRSSSTGDLYDMRFPANRRVLYRSKGVIVHSRWAKEMLSLHSGGVPVEVVEPGTGFDPSCIDRSAAASRRASSGIKDDDVVFVSLGYVSFTKRIVQSLKAFSRLAKEISGVKYLIVGEIPDSMKGPVMSVINDERLRGKVILVGYADDASFNEYVACSDVGINLRYPVIGESSGALVKIIGAGKPTIVSDEGPYGEYPDDICIKVSTGDTEIDDIYAAMKTLAADKGRRDSMGEAARAYAEKNLSLSLAAERYIRFVSIIKDEKHNE